MIDERLEQLGIVIPDPPAPAGSYVPVSVLDGTAFVSGQIPVVDGRIAYGGKTNDGNIDDARASARICAVNILAQLKRELGTLDRIAKFVRISGFVNASPEFTRHPEVINAASDMLFEIFGERGRHSRIAVGVSSLPLDSMTEIDATVEFD